MGVSCPKERLRQNTDGVREILSISLKLYQPPRASFPSSEDSLLVRSVAKVAWPSASSVVFPFVNASCYCKTRGSCCTGKPGLNYFCCLSRVDVREEAFSVPLRFCSCTMAAKHMQLSDCMLLRIAFAWPVLRWQYQVIASTTVDNHFFLALILRLNYLISSFLLGWLK